MKRLLIITCVVMMALCVSGTVSAAYFDVTEQYTGGQLVEKNDQYSFVFDFWNINTTTTNSSLTLSEDANSSDATKFFEKDPTEKMKSYFSFAYSGAGSGAAATINFFAGNDANELWSISPVISATGSGTVTYYFLQYQLDMFDDFGWGKIIISNDSSKKFKIDNATMNVVATPIPSAVWLLGSGLIGIVAVRRRFSK